MYASRSDDPTEVLGEVRPSRAGDYALSYLHIKDLNMQVCICGVPFSLYGEPLMFMVNLCTYASNYFMYIIGGTRDGWGWV